MKITVMTGLSAKRDMKINTCHAISLILAHECEVQK